MFDNIWGFHRVLGFPRSLLELYIGVGNWRVIPLGITSLKEELHCRWLLSNQVGISYFRNYSIALDYHEQMDQQTQKQCTGYLQQIQRWSFILLISVCNIIMPQHLSMISWYWASALSIQCINHFFCLLPLKSSILPWLCSLRRIRTKPRTIPGFSSDAAQAIDCVASQILCPCCEF